jgi:hypothetical protein
MQRFRPISAKQEAMHSLKNTQQNSFEYSSKTNIKCAQTILPHKMGQCISVCTAYQQMADYINFGQRTTDLNH